MKPASHLSEMTTPIRHTFWVVREDGTEESWTTTRDLRGALGDLAERLRFVPNYRSVRHKADRPAPEII